MLAVAARHNANVTNTSEAKALPYKGLSFKHLSHDLSRFGPAGMLTEPTLAVVMLFLFFETLDGGLDTWKIHIHGARRLIQLCAGQLNSSPMLQIFINHVTLIDIIGSTLASSSPGDAVPCAPVISVLREGEAYNFLGCPAELLEIIHTITISKSRGSPPPTEVVEDLLRRIDAFSPEAYIRTRHDVVDPSELLELVYAYKAAARIYTLETLFPGTTTEEVVAPYHEELRRRLGRLREGSALLKGAVWPVFVAGIGAVKEEEREWVRELLRMLWGVLPQTNIRNAGKVLEGLWRKGRGEGGWRVLEREGRDWLFI
jgi:hypothetical protein